MEVRIWHIDDIELAQGRATPERIAALSTLIVDSENISHGGLGETRQVRTAGGELLACKQMFLPLRRGFASQEAYDIEVARREQTFREEYDTLCRLSSFKGFVKARAYGHIDCVPAILMEWVEGISLADVLKEQRERLSPLAVAQIGRDIFDLLSRLEQQAELFVHRDISPSNVMVRTHERSFEEQVQAGSFDICLIDFGSAVALLEGDGAFTFDTRIIRGATPSYAPPEMLTNDLPNLHELRKSSSIDVYATCSVLYELLCGNPPFDMSQSVALGSDYLYKLMNEPLDPGFGPASLKGLLAGIICTGIRAEQSARPSTHALLEALERYCQAYPENARRAASGEELPTIDVDAPERRESTEMQVPLPGHPEGWPAASASGPEDTGVVARPQATAVPDGPDSAPSGSASAEVELAQSNPASASRRRRPAIAAAIVAAVAVVALAFAVLPSLISSGTVPVRDSLDDYSWTELSLISQEIASADEGSMLQVAEHYNLCDEGGSLLNGQAKSILLADGHEASAVIVGFACDDKSDGSGKAGITFMFSDSVAVQAANSAGVNAGGWENSEMRAWLSSEFEGRLPQDLQDALVDVDKLTNNSGKADDASVVSPTSDALWLFSPHELGGDVDWYDDAGRNDVINAEGEEYPLFVEAQVDNNDVPNDILMKRHWGDECTWWTRTPGPGGDTDFRSVLNDGNLAAGSNAANVYAIVPGFCI